MCVPIAADGELSSVDLSRGAALPVRCPRSARLQSRRVDSRNLRRVAPLRIRSNFRHVDAQSRVPSKVLANVVRRIRIPPSPLVCSADLLLQVASLGEPPFDYRNGWSKATRSSWLGPLPPPSPGSPAPRVIAFGNARILPVRRSIRSLPTSSQSSSQDSVV